MIDVSSFEFLHKITCWEQGDEIEQVKYVAECQGALSGGGGLLPESGGSMFWLQVGTSCLWAPALMFCPPVKNFSLMKPQAASIFWPSGFKLFPLHFCLLLTEPLNGDPTWLLGCRERLTPELSEGRNQHPAGLAKKDWAEFLVVT